MSEPADDEHTDIGDDEPRDEPYRRAVDELPAPAQPLTSDEMATVQSVAQRLAQLAEPEGRVHITLATQRWVAIDQSAQIESLSSQLDRERRQTMALKVALLANRIDPVTLQPMSDEPADDAPTPPSAPVDATTTDPVGDAMVRRVRGERAGPQ